MAFNMRRPIIKGTANHKTSIAKAKAESIVSQARTQSDASLVESGRLLGKSYMPGDIDFSIDIAKPNLTKKDLKDALGKKSKKTKTTEKYDDSGLVNPDTQDGDYNLEIDYPEEEKEKEEEKKKDIKKVKKVKKKKVKKKVEKDVLIGDTESADSKYVAPYVDEAEDEDDDYSGIENDNSDPTDGSTTTKKPYKNWKVKEEERNIAIAEENKAKVDAQTAEKVRRRDYKVPQIEMINIDQIPTTVPEVKLEQAGPAPESKSKVKAHNNPDYETNKPSYNSDGQQIGLGGTEPEKPGYHYDSISDQWTYNDILISPDEVRSDQFEVIMDMVRKDQEQEYNEEVDKENLNSNTPSNDSTTVDLLPQPQANTTVSTNTEQTLNPRQVREKKRADKKYNDPSTGPNVKAQMIKEGYVPNESKSSMQMRDNRIYRNAKPNGPVRKNMIQGGYTPQ